MKLWNLNKDQKSSNWCLTKKKTKLVKYINSVENYKNKNKRTQTIIKKMQCRHETITTSNDSASQRIFTTVVVVLSRRFRTIQAFNVALSIMWPTCSHRNTLTAFDTYTQSHIHTYSATTQQVQHKLHD